MCPLPSEITLCYQRPPSGEGNNDLWTLGNSSKLQVDTNKANLTDYRWLYDTNSNGNASNGSSTAGMPAVEQGICAQVGFPAGDLAHTAEQTLTLTVSYFHRDRRQAISADQLQTAIVKLKNEGIDMSVTSDGGYSFNSMPAGMTPDKAKRLK